MLELLTKEYIVASILAWLQTLYFLFKVRRGHVIKSKTTFCLQYDRHRNSSQILVDSAAKVCDCVICHFRMVLTGMWSRGWTAVSPNIACLYTRLLSKTPSKT